MRRLQGSVTKSLRVALPSFRKLYDLLCDCVSGRGYDPVCVLEGYKSHLEGCLIGMGAMCVSTGENLIENMRL